MEGHLGAPAAWVHSVPDHVAIFALNPQVRLGKVEVQKTATLLDRVGDHAPIMVDIAWERVAPPLTLPPAVPSPPARRLPLTVPPPPARPPPSAIDDGKEFEAYIDASGRLVEEF